MSASTCQVGRQPGELGDGLRLERLPATARGSVLATDVTVLGQREFGSHYRELVLAAPEVAAAAAPGQFVMITVAGTGEVAPALPRPMAIHSVDRDEPSITVVYAVVGAGTRKLARFGVGDRLHLVGPLGRGFDLAGVHTKVLLLGRGIGTCSLTTVVQACRRDAIGAVVVTSARAPASLVGAEFCRGQGATPVIEVTDAEGTSDPAHLRGRLIRELDPAPPEVIMVCGSNRLASLALELAERWGVRVQVSLEAHMACGLGYCHGCASSIPGAGEESPLICVDGPVFGLTRQGRRGALGGETSSAVRPE